MSGTLEARLHRIPGTRRCLLGVPGSETAAGLLLSVAATREQLQPLAGARVALRGLAPADLVHALVALDGVADAILLLPPSVDDATASDLMRGSRINAVVTASVTGLQGNVLAGGETASSVGETRWILATSGTTGTPKLIEHTLRTLTRTFSRFEDRGGDFVWGLFYDANRYAGLQVVLQALCSGSALALPVSADFESQVRAVQEHPVNAISATPTLWRKLLMDGRLAGSPLRVATLGGETADQLILDALKVAFPHARITHIYASTEAGTGFSVKDGRAGFPASWLDDLSRVPAVAISDEQHLLLKAPVMPSGAAVSARLRPDGFFDTEDLVELCGDRVVFLGRASGAINVGGNKVSPEVVEAFLRGLDGVADARVYGRANSVTGQLVAAEILPKPGAHPKELRPRILAACRQGLASWEVPALVSFVTALRETAAGKRARIS